MSILVKHFYLFTVIALKVQHFNRWANVADYVKKTVRLINWPSRRVPNIRSTLTEASTSMCVRVQGLFSRMTFRRELFLGGFKNVSKPSSKTGATGGFIGCVRRLQINSKDYDMRKGSFLGNTLYGVNVGQFRFFRTALSCPSPRCLVWLFLTLWFCFVIMQYCLSIIFYDAYEQLSTF